MLYVFGGRIYESSPYALSVGFFAFKFISLMGVSWVQPSDVRDKLLAWTRRMKKSWILGIWNMASLVYLVANWKERN